jgi:hypothetical protein
MKGTATLMLKTEFEASLLDYTTVSYEKGMVFVVSATPAQFFPQIYQMEPTSAISGCRGKMGKTYPKRESTNNGAYFPDDTENERMDLSI